MDNLDWLKDFTKEEIIKWIEENTFFSNRIKKSDLLFIRWQIKIKDLEVKESKELENLRKIDCKKRDALAKQYNASHNSKEKLELLSKISVIDKQLKLHFERSEVLNKEREKADLIYKQMSECRE